MKQNERKYELSCSSYYEASKKMARMFLQNAGAFIDEIKADSVVVTYSRNDMQEVVDEINETNIAGLAEMKILHCF